MHGSSVQGDVPGWERYWDDMDGLDSYLAGMYGRNGYFNVFYKNLLGCRRRGDRDGFRRFFSMALGIKKDVFEEYPI
jgi:hypothetical protein